MIDLGKWPTLRVLGERVTPDQGAHADRLRQAFAHLTA